MVLKREWRVVVSEWERWGKWLKGRGLGGGGRGFFPIWNVTGDREEF
jgi:hypothetical protein